MLRMRNAPPSRDARSKNRQISDVRFRSRNEQGKIPFAADLPGRRRQLGRLPNLFEL
jgi:hypothetical protein